MPSWLIPDGFLPDDGAATTHESHEALCVLNPTDEDATVYPCAPRPVAHARR